MFLESNFCLIMHNNRQNFKHVEDDSRQWRTNGNRNARLDSNWRSRSDKDSFNDRASYNGSNHSQSSYNARRQPSNWSSSSYYRPRNSNQSYRGGKFQSNGQRNSYNNRQSNSFYDNQPADINWESEQQTPAVFQLYNEMPKVAERTSEFNSQFYERKNITIVSGSDCKNPVIDFDEANFPVEYAEKLKSQGFEEPTSIQSVSWPNALSGKDIIGIAQTGSGKTLAFLLPAFVHVEAQLQTKRTHSPIAVIILPTRELAQQVQSVIQKFVNPKSLRFTCIYGGSAKYPQINSLKNGCDLLVATPGRLIDYLQNGIVSLKSCTYLVLDEADRMLDMGFEPQIRQIVEYVRPDRQTLMWSATWPEKIRRLAQDFLKKPIHLQVGSTSLAANTDILQNIEICEESDKYYKLLDLMNSIATLADNKTIIFIETKKKCDRIGDQLYRQNFPVVVIHGDKSQQDRNWAISQFRSGRLPILVATDVASRGLDVYDVRFVINFDFPGEIENYVQRIGRTARAGQTGTSYSFITKDDSRNANNLIKVLRESKQYVSPELESMSKWSSKGSRYSRRPSQMYGVQFPGYPTNGNEEQKFMMMPGGPVLI